MTDAYDSLLVTYASAECLDKNKVEISIETARQLVKENIEARQITNGLLSCPFCGEAADQRHSKSCWFKLKENKAPTEELMVAWNTRLKKQVEKDSK